MKSILPDEPIFSIPTLLMGTLRATPAEPVRLIYKSESQMAQSAKNFVRRKINNCCILDHIFDDNLYSYIVMTSQNFNKNQYGIYQILKIFTKIELLK